MTQQDSQFMLDLLLQENKHFNPIDFIDFTNVNNKYACMVITLGFASKFRDVQQLFQSGSEFNDLYLKIYTDAMINFQKIVNGAARQVYYDEANAYYNLTLHSESANDIVNDEIKKGSFFQALEITRMNNTYMIVMRNETAFIIVHLHDDDFIIIDPHVEFCGLISYKTVYRYATYDDVWCFTLYWMCP